MTGLNTSNIQNTVDKYANWGNTDYSQYINNGQALQEAGQPIVEQQVAGQTSVDPSTYNLSEGNLAYDPNDPSTWNEAQKQSFLSNGGAAGSGGMSGQQMQGYLDMAEAGTTAQDYIPNVSGGMGDNGLNYNVTDPNTGQVMQPKSAYQLQQEGYDQRAGAYSDMIDKGAGYLDPYRKAGETGLNRLTAGMESGQYDPGAFQYGGAGPESRSIESFMQDDPSYAFELAEGQKAIDRGAAAGGRFGGGQTAKELMNYSQGLASKNYGQRFDRASQERNAQAMAEQQGYGRATQGYGMEADRLGTQFGQDSGLAGMGQQAATATGGMYSGLGSQLLGQQFQQQMQDQKLKASGQSDFWDNMGGLAGIALSGIL